MNGVNIHFYGERGVINGIILDIQDNKAKIDRFFSAIRLLGTDKLPWASGVKNCSWLVEPSFAQFGNPDCIAVFESAGKKFALFFEVKLKDYESSCISIGPEMIQKTNKSKEAYKGQSSKLNVQLSFRYRFVQAFELRRQSQTPLPSIIEKNDEYPDGCQRKLDKPIVLEFISNFLKGVDEFYFIALTNDAPGQMSIQKMESNFSPPLFVNDTDQFTQNKKHFGLLTYGGLLDSNVISEQAGFFGTASKMMNLSPPGRIPSVPATISNARAINGTKLIEWRKRREWAKPITEDKRLHFDELEGSYSSKVSGKVVMKLMAAPEDVNKLMIGLIDNGRINEENTKGIIPVKYRINGKEFLFYSFTDGQIDAIHELALLYIDSFFSENANLVDSTQAESTLNLLTQEIWHRHN